MFFPLLLSAIHQFLQISVALNQASFTQYIDMPCARLPDFQHLVNVQTVLETNFTLNKVMKLKCFICDQREIGQKPVVFRPPAANVIWIFRPFASHVLQVLPFKNQYLEKDSNGDLVVNLTQNFHPGPGHYSCALPNQINRNLFHLRHEYLIDELLSLKLVEKPTLEAVQEAAQQELEIVFRKLKRIQTFDLKPMVNWSSSPEKSLFDQQLKEVAKRNITDFFKTTFGQTFQIGYDFFYKTNCNPCAPLGSADRRDRNEIHCRFLLGNFTKRGISCNSNLLANIPKLQSHLRRLPSFVVYGNCKLLCLNITLEKPPRNDFPHVALQDLSNNITSVEQNLQSFYSRSQVVIDFSQAKNLTFLTDEKIRLRCPVHQLVNKSGLQHLKSKISKKVMWFKMTDRLHAFRLRLLTKGNVRIKNDVLTIFRLNKDFESLYTCMVQGHHVESFSLMIEEYQSWLDFRCPLYLMVFVTACSSVVCAVLLLIKYKLIHKILKAQKTDDFRFQF